MVRAEMAAVQECGLQATPDIRGAPVKKKRAAVVIQMPDLGHVANGKFWFFLPVPFLYKLFPFKRGERLLVEVTRYKP